MRLCLYGDVTVRWPKKHKKIKLVTSHSHSPHTVHFKQVPLTFVPYDKLTSHERFTSLSLTNSLGSLLLCVAFYFVTHILLDCGRYLYFSCNSIIDQISFMTACI